MPVPYFKSLGLRERNPVTRVTILSIKQAVWDPSRLGSRLGVMYQIGPWKHKSEMKLGFGVTRAGIDFRADVAMCVLSYI